MDQSLMAFLVYLTTEAPSTLAAEMTQQGHCVFEALAISEVLHLLETQDIDAVVVASDVNKDLSEIQEQRVTLTLKAGATIADVVWQLSQLFPTRAMIQ